MTSRRRRAREFAYLNSHFQTGFTNPLDAAILAGVPEPADLVAYTKRAELPYDFTRRLLSVVVHKEDEVPLLITKGAPEAVLLRASRVRGESSVRPIGPEEHERLARLVAGVSAEGYRLVAVGSRARTAEEGARVDSAGRLPPLDPRTVETDLVFEGLVLFSDPPKAGVEETIAQLARDRVALKVVTGDNDLVARHVAGQVGLAVDDILTGDEIRGMTPAALVARASASTTPPTSPGRRPTSSSWNPAWPRSIKACWRAGAPSRTRSSTSGWGPARTSATC